MGKIRLLPDEIISKIAAGEVIERPASVVKELVENAIDAQTSSIELRLKQSGKTFIHIKDTGTGIEYDDMENVFFRHATSKINELSDLNGINSLGFRGEALYSIAAISDVTLRSKTDTADAGWEIRARNNKKLSLKPVNLITGTEIEVAELFFNTPARKKFLKSDAAELNRILDIFIPYTILYPEIRFLLINNHKTLLDLPAEKNRIPRIAKTLNLRQGHIVENEKDFSGQKIKLILGDINIQRADKNLQFIFVNGRPVENRNLDFHINEAYRSILPAGVKPFFSVFITVPAEEVDVNVHPAKREVKIKNERYLASILRCFCEQTLMTKTKAKQFNPPIFEIPAKKETVSYRPGTFSQTAKDFTIADNLSLFKSYPPFLKNGKEYINPPFEKRGNWGDFNQQNSLADKLSAAEYIGIFKRKYIIFETSDSLLLIDQHAGHERITFEKLKKQIESGKIEIQNLLTPLLIRITRQEKLVWQETQEKLEKLGFSTTEWDDESIAVHSHPRLITDPEIAVGNILSGEHDNAQIDLTALSRRACRKSVMVGDKIGKEAAEYLKKELLGCADPFICPHGRPTVIEIPESLLNKPFLR